jgi:hypothetical protein
MQTNPDDIQITERDLGGTHVAHTQAYDLQGYTGDPTYALFGAWQTEHEQGFVATTNGPNGPKTHISREERNDRNIAAELKDRVEQVIEQSQTPQQTTSNETPTPHPDPEPQPTQPAQLEPANPTTQTQNTNQDQDRDRDRGYIDQIIQEQRDRQQNWEQGISPDQDNDRSYGIE